MEINLVTIGAALALGIAWFGVTLGQMHIARTSMEILGKNPRIASTLLVYTILGLALVESAAIYALVVAFQIIAWGDAIAANAIGAGLVIGLTGCVAGYGEWKLVATSMEALNRNPENKNQVLQFMILFMALIEVIAIYGLIIAFQILG